MAGWRLVRLHLEEWGKKSYFLFFYFYFFPGEVNSMLIVMCSCLCMPYGSFTTEMIGKHSRLLRRPAWAGVINKPSHWEKSEVYVYSDHPVSTGLWRVADLLSGFRLNCQLPESCASCPNESGVHQVLFSL